MQSLSPKKTKRLLQEWKTKAPQLLRKTRGTKPGTKRGSYRRKT